MSAVLDQLLRQYAAAVPLDFLSMMAVKGSLVLGLGYLAVIVFRRAPASLRHYILGLAIVGAGVLPVVATIAPELEISPLTTLAPQREFSATVMRYNAPEVLSLSAVRQPITPGRAEKEVPIPWTSWVGLFWCLGAAAMLARITVGVAGSRWIISGGASVQEPRLRQLVERCEGEIHIRRRIGLYFSARTNVPFACGLFRPRVILPAAATGWSDERLHLVLLHEMAHIRRGDLVFHALSRFVSVMYWFNPLYWVAVRRANLERERSADDLVLAVGAKPHIYARHLLDIGKSLAGSRCLAAAGIGMARPSLLGRRIMDIISTKRNRTTLTFVRCLVSALIAVAVIVPLAGITGQAADNQLQGVTDAEKNEIIGTLVDFYDALTNGEDFSFVCDFYLTADYFDQPELTKENLGRDAWRVAFDNTMKMYTGLINNEFIGPPTVHSRIKSIRREGNRYFVKQDMDILVPCEQGDQYIVKSLEHESVLVHEGNGWKVARFNGGVSVMRMDVNNPYGPIFLIWVHDIDPATTPHGDVIFKVFPAEYRTEGTTQLAFQLEGDDGQ